MRLTVQVDSFAYPRQQALLRDIHLTLDQGEILAVLGPNGVGKTTLIKGMLGLIPGFSSRSRLDGMDLRQMPAQQVWQQIGYVPQAREHRSSLLVEEMILLGRSARIGLLRQPTAKDIAAVSFQMEQLGIGHLRGRSCATLSGGQLQMALLARALCNHPRFLVLDEPESNLDYRNQVRILSRLVQLAQEDGIASLLITHFPQHALQIADKVLLLFPEHTHVFGPAAEVLTPENLQKAYGVDVHIEHLCLDGRVYPSILIKDFPVRSRDGEGGGHKQGQRP